MSVALKLGDRVSVDVELTMMGGIERGAQGTVIRIQGTLITVRFKREDLASRPSRDTRRHNVDLLVHRLEVELSSPLDLIVRALEQG